MAYVVTEACILCKYQECVEVCPVDCFYEGENTLVINPAECVDCGVCEHECPVDAIKPHLDAGQAYTRLNLELARIWPKITTKGAPMPEADRWAGVPNKLAKMSREPAARS